MFFKSNPSGTISKCRWYYVLACLLIFIASFAVEAQESTRYAFCTDSAAINQTTSTTIITGTSGQRIYVCGIILVSATAQNISLVEGTGTVCATGIAALIGGTTASVALAANGGFVGISHKPWMATQVNTNNLCVLQSGAGNVSGTISYKKIVP